MRAASENDNSRPGGDCAALGAAAATGVASNIATAAGSNAATHTAADGTHCSASIAALIDAHPSLHDVTRLLDAVGAGDCAARERLLELVYHELRQMAAAHLAREGQGRHPGRVQPTTLVHEAYLRLFAPGNGHFGSRRHFFGAAAQAMRRILVDDARKRGRLKRGGGRRAASLELEPATFDLDPAEMLALEEALSRLEQYQPRAAEVVHLRYFAGLSGDQVAEVMGVSPRTVDAEWCMARAWLFRVLSADD